MQKSIKLYNKIISLNKMNLVYSHFDIKNILNTFLSHWDSFFLVHSFIEHLSSTTKCPIPYQDFMK